MNWSAWAALTLWLAPLPLLAQVAVFVFFQNRPEYPLVALGVSVVTVAVLLSSIFLGKRSSLRVIPPTERRKLMSLNMTTIGLIVRRVAREATARPSDFETSSRVAATLLDGS